MTSSDPFASPAPTPRVSPAPSATAASTAVAERPEGPVAAAEDPKAKAAPKARASGHAYAGVPVEVGEAPAAPVWPQDVSPEASYVPSEEFDAQDLSQVNLEINRCRARLFRTSMRLRDAERDLAEKDMIYQRAMRRAIVQTSGGSADSRKMIAEMQCEAFENDLVVARQIVAEWKKRSTDVRDDLKAVENLSHNVRAQMDLR